MNPDLARLQPYPFERLAALKAGVEPPAGLAPIALSIGEPKHAAPGFILDEIQANLRQCSAYPTTKGEPALRRAISAWLEGRFSLPTGSVDPERQVLPVNGTREALFAIAQAVVERSRDARSSPMVAMPNPFYQIYEGAALLAGAEPYFLACRAENGFIPDFEAVPAEVWRRCQLLYVCSPGNPTGAVIAIETLQRLIRLAQEFDFVIASDECYSELYPDETRPPPGLLQAAAAMGETAYRHCLVFHSLSKRSNLPGMRSGFVAGDAALIERFLLYRTYHGCAMPIQHQRASTLAWNDEGHVVGNRALYNAKFDAVLEALDGVLEVARPAAGFYLWARVPGSDTEFARELFRATNVTVLPGSFLSRPQPGGDPGANRIRLALVAHFEECVEATERIRAFVQRGG